MSPAEDLSQLRELIEQGALALAGTPAKVAFVVSEPRPRAWIVNLAADTPQWRELENVAEAAQASALVVGSTRALRAIGTEPNVVADLLQSGELTVFGTRQLLSDIARALRAGGSVLSVRAAALRGSDAQ